MIMNASYLRKNSSKSFIGTRWIQAQGMFRLLKMSNFSSSIGRPDSLFYMKKPICIYLDCAKVQSDAQW